MNADPLAIFREVRELARAGDTPRAQAFVARLRPASAQRTAAMLGLAIGQNAGERALAQALALAGAQAVLLLRAVGEGLLDSGCIAEAEAVLAHAHRQDPDDGDTLWRRAEALLELGEVPAALALANQVQARYPHSPLVAAGAAHMLNYLPEAHAAQVRAAHAAFAATIRPAEALPPVVRRPGNGRVRVAIVSPDLYTHSVAFFLEPLLAQWRATSVPGLQPVDVLLVNTGVRHDAVTERLVALVGGPGHFLDAGPVSGLSPAEAVAAVRAWSPPADGGAAPGVDIALDLAGLTPFNGLPLLAHRMAPLQATWLGYPNTTAVPEIDVRIVDALTDPPPLGNGPCTERLVRMDAPFVCYRPPSTLPEVAPQRPSSRPITFGSFNIARKVSDACAALWARVLLAVPNSRLIVKSATLASPASRRRLAERLCRAGVPADRLTVLSPVPGVLENLAAYHQVDVALDTWPYCGATTTCEALLMGVPVVTLTGETHASRVGASLLHAAGFSQWIANTADGFVQSASALAVGLGSSTPPPNLIRERFRQSPLCDASGFARRFSSALVAAGSLPA
jgi:protein O-GlcNAc transferase